MTDKKPTREMPIGKAIEAIRMIDADEEKAITEGRAKSDGRVRRRHAKFRQTVLSKVHPSAVEIVLKEAGRKVPPCFVPKGDDVPPMTSEEIDEAVAELPAGARPYVESAVAKAARVTR